MKDVYTVPLMARSLKGCVMRDSRVGCSSSADLPDVDTAPLPESCSLSLAPLTGLPVELLGSTPVACT